MKLYLLVLIFCISDTKGCRSQVPAVTKETTLKFLYKTKLDTAKENYGEHIEVRHDLPDSKEFILLSIDDRDIMSRAEYSFNEKIKVLYEFLSFRYDTMASNKKYIFTGASHMVRPQGIEGFTIQIEALYSFTRMLTIGYPPIMPMLINRKTSEELNKNTKAVNEIYDIYLKWYNDNKKTDFKNISLPLTGSPYCWLGEDKGIEPYLKKSF